MHTQFKFEAIGTGWVIDVWDNVGLGKEEDILKQVRDRIDIFDKNYSRFRDDSLVTEISQKTGTYVLPADAELMMDIYYALFKLTGGLLTPLIGQVMVDAGYDAKYSLKQIRELESPLDWDDVLEYSHPNLKVKEQVILDFGAAGKGYLIDIVADVLRGNGLENFCIDAGGDILHNRKDGVPIKIGLENPENFEQVIGVCDLLNQSLCGSAGSRRHWNGLRQNFHHIIHPKKLESPKDILATWVIADTTLVADALATSLFFVSPETLLSQYDFKYVIIYADYSILRSNNFPGEIFTI